MKRATIKDVAALAGVSYQTVSRVINNQPGVNEYTRERVEQAIKSLDYRPNLAARSLPRRRSNIIGLIIPYDAAYLFRDPHLLAQISGIDAEANAHGYNVLLSTAGDAGSGIEAYERFVRNQVADGALVVETASIHAGNQLLSQYNYKYVNIGFYLENGSGYSVNHDARFGAQEATRHLLSRGHTRIGIIDGPSIGAVESLRQRMLGHKDALKEAGLPFNPNLVVYGDYTRVSGQVATKKLLALPEPPTAILALNDRMAMGAIRALQDGGLRVPEDIAVIGFDDIPASVDFYPALTTVRQPSTKIGRLAAQLLFRLIDGEPVDNRQVMVPTELIIRQSA